MFKDKTSAIVSTVLLSVFIVGVAFQNCAQPLDPDLLNGGSATEGSSLPGNDENFVENPGSQDLSLSFAIFPERATVSDSISVIATATGGQGQYTYSLKKNGVEISTFEAYQIPPSLPTDKFTMTVSDGVNQLTRDIPILIGDGSSGGSSGGSGSSGGGGTFDNSSTIYLKNMNNTLSFSRRFVDAGKSLRFIAVRDTSKTNPNVPTITIHWEKKSSFKNTWSYFKSGNELSVIASHTDLNAQYRAVGVNSRDSSHKGYSATVEVITQKYYQNFGEKPVNLASLANHAHAPFICDYPYVLSGVTTGKIGTKKECIEREGSGICRRYRTRNVYAVKQQVCSLVQSEKLTISWIGLQQTGAAIDNNGDGNADCNYASSDVKTRFLEGVMIRDHYNKHIRAVCAKPTLSNAVILNEGAQISLSFSDTDKTFECPKYRYITNFYGGNSGMRFNCGFVRQ